MEQAVWIFLGTMAFVATGVMWTTIIDPRLLIAPGAMWIVWGFGATNVEITTQCCVNTQTYQSLAILGWVIGAVVLVFWLGAVTGRVDLD